MEDLDLLPAPPLPLHRCLLLLYFILLKQNFVIFDFIEKLLGEHQVVHLACYAVPAGGVHGVPDQ